MDGAVDEPVGSWATSVFVVAGPVMAVEPTGTPPAGHCVMGKRTDDAARVATVAPMRGPGPRPCGLRDFSEGQIERRTRRIRGTLPTGRIHQYKARLTLREPHAPRPARHPPWRVDDRCRSSWLTSRPGADPEEDLESHRGDPAARSSTGSLNILHSAGCLRGRHGFSECHACDYGRGSDRGASFPGSGLPGRKQRNGLRYAGN